MKSNYAQLLHFKNSREIYWVEKLRFIWWIKKASIVLIWYQSDIKAYGIILPMLPHALKVPPKSNNLTFQLVWKNIASSYHTALRLCKYTWCTLRIHKRTQQQRQKDHHTPAKPLKKKLKTFKPKKNINRSSDPTLAQMRKLEMPI